MTRKNESSKRYILIDDFLIGELRRRKEQPVLREYLVKLIREEGLNHIPHTTL